MSDLATILPPNTTQTERDLEQVMARIAQLPVPISTLWNVETCPENMLPYLAWALSVDVWDANWSLEVKRGVVRQAVPMHRVKGTRASVERALSALGFTMDLSEWFEHGGAVHTFRIEAYGDDVYDAGFQINAELFATVSRVIQNTKPARSQFELRIGESFGVATYLRGGIRAAYIHRLDLQPSARTQIAATSAYLRSGLRARITSRITHVFQVREGAAYAV